MIDIHSHILPCVDDGSKDEQTSIAMLNESVNQGITEIVLTPHYRGGFKLTATELKERFDSFRDKVDSLEIPISLYLGQEIYVSQNYKTNIKDKKVLSLNGTDYVLIEFNFDSKKEIAETVYELVTMGYKPIVAHIERYSYADLDVAEEVKSIGGLIQVNAESIVGKHKKIYRKFIKGLFKNGLVDFVASDIHSARINYMAKAFEFVNKKYGQEVAEKVFNVNAKEIIKG